MKMRMWKRAALLPALALAVGMVPPAGATEHVTIERKGSIKVNWNLILAVTEADWAISKGCAEEPDTIPNGGTQGLDAYVIALPEGSENQRIEMTYLRALGDVEPTGIVLTSFPDIDWGFFDSECNYLGSSGMATGTALEKGLVPEGATFAVAYLFLGSPSTFTVEIDAVVPAA